MKAVILAGGLGTRLRPFTEVIPKPLMPLGEKSLLEVQILALKDSGFKEIYIATNYKSDYIEKFLGNGERYGVHLFFSKEENPLGTCGPLTLLKDSLSQPFILMNGDILTKLNFREFYSWSLNHPANLVVATKTIIHPFSFGNVSANSCGRVVDVEEKPNLHFDILAGIYFMKPGVFEWIPDAIQFGIDELIKKMLHEDEPIYKYQIHDYWIDIGQVDDFSRAQDEYETNFNGKTKSS